ncbi:helix-turn-helix transcriptional regulator [Neobacillus niacini]|uniref:helix-turn-helix domain-containing protein n=1 Tax=Neobacillus niacini TaxID=86668 RepID=UPI002FFFDA3C
MKDTSYTRKQFGQRLKEVRSKYGYNMQYVSERIGVARSTYAGYETQERFPPIEVLARIADVLHTSTDYLIGVTDDPEPKELTRNVDEYLTSVSKLNWNGIPLSNDDIKPIKDLFELVMRERVPKMKNDNNEDYSAK